MPTRLACVVDAALPHVTALTRAIDRPSDDRLPILAGDQLMGAVSLLSPKHYMDVASFAARHLGDLSGTTRAICAVLPAEGRSGADDRAAPGPGAGVAG